MGIQLLKTEYKKPIAMSIHQHFSLKPFSVFIDIRNEPQLY